MSERKVIQNQRVTENTMSNNRQSVLEHDYTAFFRDGKRVDVADFILKKLQKSSKTGTPPAVENLRASRLPCLIFEVKYPGVIRICSVKRLLIIVYSSTSKYSVIKLLQNQCFLTSSKTNK